MTAPNDTPVLVIAFRRPDLTQRVLRAVAESGPRPIYVFADGPRDGHPSDVPATAATRAVIAAAAAAQPLRYFFADRNLGCARGPATAIDWVFQDVEAAIILEDDCVPHPTFFPYCDELLARYRDDERVMHIAGTIYRRKPIPVDTSYVFSQFNSAWGWATWRRAWRLFDFSVSLWPDLRQTTWLSDLLGVDEAVRYWAREFDGAMRPGYSTWDHQWTFACWANSGLSIAPRVNLVTNMGCGTDATHTFDPTDPIANIPAEALTFPLRHPPTVLQDRAWDREFLRDVILPRLHPPSPSALRILASRVLPDPVKRQLHAWAAGRMIGRARPS